MRTATREVAVDCAPSVDGLSPTTVARVIRRVLDAEYCGDAECSVAFLSAQKMRALNRRSFGVDRATDVISYGMPHSGVLIADIYICPSVARRNAKEQNVPVEEELIRLVVHGTLHSLGYDHPAGRTRYSSSMWTLQESYLTEILGGSE